MTDTGYPASRIRWAMRTLVRGQCAGAAGLLAAGAGCLPGDGGLFVDQLALVLGQRVKIPATIRPTGAE
jgi:hypothetical protein